MVTEELKWFSIIIYFKNQILHFYCLDQFTQLRLSAQLSNHLYINLFIQMFLNFIIKTNIPNSHSINESLFIIS